MRHHAIYSALLDSDSDVEFAETKRRKWPPQHDVAPAVLPVLALGGQSARPLAAQRLPHPSVPDFFMESTRPVAVENFTRPLVGDYLEISIGQESKREKESEEKEREDNWRPSKIWANKSLWPAWGDGICDVREFRRDGRRSTEGRDLKHCMTECDKIVKVNCVLKIGMYQNISHRWGMYVGDIVDGRWQPNILFLLATVDGRSAAAFLDAAMINYIGGNYMDSSINRLRGDRGGEGPPRPESRFAPHSVYAAVSPK